MPNPSAGIIRGIAAPAAVLLGGYIVISRLTGWNPAGDALQSTADAFAGAAKSVGDAVGSVSKPIGDAITSAGATVSTFIANQVVQTGALRFSKNPVVAGDQIHITMQGLQPFQDVRITWTQGGLDTGSIRASADGKIDILFTIPNVAPNTYQVNATVTYIAGDTRTFAANLIVQAPPAPGVETIRGEMSISPWNNVSPTALVTVNYRLVKYVDNERVGYAEKEGVRVWGSVNGQMIAEGVTGVTGRFAFGFQPAAFGLGSGEHSVDVYPFPYDANKESDTLLVETGRIIVI